MGLPGWAPLKYPSISPQVTLSYGVFEGKLNIIKLPGPFSHEEDPSRWVWAEVQGGGGDRTSAPKDGGALRGSSAIGHG